MTDIFLSPIINVNDKYFVIMKANKKHKIYTLNYFLSLFDFNDFYCYKSSNLPREVSYEDFLKFEYAGYVFYNKKLYNKKDIDLWIEWYSKINGLKYLTKPVPPFNPYKKIIIKND